MLEVLALLGHAFRDLHLGKNASPLQIAAAFHGF